MSVSELQIYLLKYKKFLAIFVSLSIFLCAIFINVSQSYTAEIYIKYLGDKAEDGLTENGKKLNPYEISDAFVVKKALENIGAESASYNTIRKSISVSPVILSSEEAKYASYIDNFSDYDNTEENKTQPVYFSVKFTSKQSDEFARKFLKALIEEYRIYYVEKYAYSDDMTLISEDAVMQYDYFETAKLLEGKIRNNISYLNNIISGDTDFRSAQTGYSMRDLAVAYDSLLKNDLSGASRIILENGISKNSTVLKNTLQNQSDAAILESNMNAEKVATQKELLETYSKKNKEYVWDTIGDDDDNQIHSDIERDRTYSTDKSVYDQMILDYVDYSIKSKNLLIDKDIYTNSIGYFSNESSQNTQVEKVLLEICKKYNTIQQLTEKTIDDYNNYKSARYLTTISGVATSDDVNELVYYVSTLVLSLGFGVIAIVFLELTRKKKI